MKNNLDLLNMENIALETGIQAAIGCYDFIGKNDADGADAEAVKRMRNVMSAKAFAGTVVIGEGERDEAPMLYIGEKLGSGGIECDIAVDPLEGTNLCAKNLPGSITAISIAEKSSLLHAPDTYMLKIASSEIGNGVISLEVGLRENILNLAKAKKKQPQDMSIIMLDRERHIEYIDIAKSLGLKIHLISDGDLSAIVQVASHNSDIDLYFGSGGAPEGVLSATCLKSLGGYMEGRLLFKNEDEKARAGKMGVSDFNKIYKINDMVKSEAVTVLTGVTNGSLLNGISKHGEKYRYHSYIMHTSDFVGQKVKMIWGVV
jgi:fructose-1,6-bisphosphatase II / sedoheptulose-1,7-bisphosphatase